MADLSGMLQAAAGNAGGVQPSNIVFLGSAPISLTGRTSDTIWDFNPMYNASDTLTTVPILEDDLVVITLVCGGVSAGGISVVTSGYTTLHSDVQLGPAGYYCNFLTSYKFMGSTPDTTVQFSGSGSTANAITGMITFYRNVNKTDTFPVIETDYLSTSARPFPPPITPPSGAFDILCAGGATHTRGNGSYTNSQLTYFRSTSANDTYDSTVGVGSIEWTGGTFTPVQFGWGLSDGNYGAISFSAAMRST